MWANICGRLNSGNFVESNHDRKICWQKIPRNGQRTFLTFHEDSFRWKKFRTIWKKRGFQGRLIPFHLSWAHTTCALPETKIWLHLDKQRKTNIVSFCFNAVTIKHTKLKNLPLISLTFHILRSKLCFWQQVKTCHNTSLVGDESCSYFASHEAFQTQTLSGNCLKFVENE